LALHKGDSVVWQLNYREEDRKPHFHPLRTLGGADLTELRPDDHPWHRGLWFSWKFINGLNYWEEDRKTGVSQGTTELASCKVEPQADFSARITMRLSYHPPGAAEVLAEKRVLEISAPDARGAYHINWKSEFKATQAAELTRTPLAGEPGGKSWGGYAGLSLRLAKSARGCSFGSDRIAPQKEAKGAHGSDAKWFACTLPDRGKGGISIFDNTANPSTTRWYVTPGMPFMSPAVLWQKPLQLAKGESLSLAYRVLVFSTAMERSALVAEWKRCTAK
jgi:hypothetical protein